MTKTNTLGISILLKDELLFKPWYLGGKYAWYYRFQIEAEFHNPVAGNSRRQLSSNVVTQKFELRVEQSESCGTDNEVKVKKHEKKYKVGNDPTLAPLKISINTNDLFQLALAKCKPNAVFQITAYYGGIDDTAFTSVEDTRASK